MEGEHAAAPRFRILEISEVRFRPCGFVEEGQRLAVCGQCIRQTVAVFARLGLHTGEGVPRWLCLNHAGRLAVNVQQIVGGAVAGFQPELADHNAPGGREIE